MIDPKTGKHIYPQAKVGNPQLDWKDYVHLVENTNNEVWLFRTTGGVKGNENVKVADPNELFSFVGTPEAKKILPKSIINWYDYLMDH